MSLLGIDVGTTGCKAAAFSDEGRCLAIAYREYATIYPKPGRVELDSRHVLEQVWKAVAEVAAQTQNDPIRALSVSTIGEAMTPVSMDGKILGNCILMFDDRGAQYADQLTEKIGQQAFYEINPNILGGYYSLPKLLWLRDNDLKFYERAEKFLLWGDLVLFALGCEPLTSYSLANRTLLFDIRQEDWSDKLLELTGIQRSKLPKCVSSGTVAGTVSDSMAARLGLPKGVQVVVGGHDQCCNSFGAGIHEPGKAVCGIGTVECITPTYNYIPDAATMLANGLNVEHHLLPGLYVSFLYNQAGSLVRWFRDAFAGGDKKILKEDTDIYDVLTAEMPAEPTSLLVLPYFSVTGPPGFVANASGAIVGLKNSTKRGEILKAIMESETFYFLESIQALKSLGIDATEFIATGGGAKSDAWLQIKADILGVPFVRLLNTEGSVAGAAMLAGLASGVYNNPSEAVQCFVHREKVFEPNLSRNKAYQERYELYRQLYPCLAGLLAKL
ncbi:MAG: hypothetical protein GWP14_09250 [Actinobacteria bacterium]|nr:hypothetical protein [Actinomycetota bacterium]